MTQVAKGFQAMDSRLQGGGQLGWWSPPWCSEFLLGSFGGAAVIAQSSEHGDGAVPEMGVGARRGHAGGVTGIVSPDLGRH